MCTEVSIVTSAPERMSMSVKQRVGDAACAAVAARRLDGNRDGLVIQHEPRDVDVVHRRVGDRHRRLEMAGRRSVAMNAVEHERKSDRAFSDRLLHRAILRIETAHEANLNKPPSECGFRIKDC